MALYRLSGGVSSRANATAINCAKGSFVTHPFDSARTMLNFFWPGSFPDPLHLPFEPEEAAPEPKLEKMPGALLSVSEVASIFGVTEDTIRKWARAGKITSVRLSKVDVRFRQVDLDEFIRSRLNRRKSAFSHS
jgi:excisionase family DNA binding protein